MRLFSLGETVENATTTRERERKDWHQDLIARPPGIRECPRSRGNLSATIAEKSKQIHGQNAKTIPLPVHWSPALQVIYVLRAVFLLQMHASRETHTRHMWGLAACWAMRCDPLYVSWSNTMGRCSPGQAGLPRGTARGLGLVKLET